MFDLIEGSLKSAINVILWIILISSIVIGFVAFGWRPEVSSFHGVVVEFSIFRALLGVVVGAISGMVANFIFGGIIVTLISIKETTELLNNNLVIMGNSIKNDEKTSNEPKKPKQIGTPVMPKKEKDINFNWQD